MTVREAVGALAGAKKLHIAWEGATREFDPEDELMMDAFGMYLVKKIVNSCELDCFEIHIAAQPVKEAAG